VAFGIWLGQGLAGMYQKSFHFPYLRFVLDWRVAGIGTAVSLLAALAGTAHAVYAAADEPIAEAMRPPAPQHFRKTFLEIIGLSRLLSPSTRMIWRQLERRPVKALLTIVAIAFASAIVMMAQFQKASIEHIAAVEFRLANRHDIAATLIEARPAGVLNELRAIEGVEQAEGLRSLPVRIHHDNHRKLVSLEGIPQGAQLRRLINTALQPVSLPDSGLVLDEMLANILGRQQRLYLPVVQRVPSYTGLAAYMDFDALNRLLGDSDLINNARLTVRSGVENAVLHALDEYPQILGAEERDAGLAALRKIINENLAIFTFIVLVMGIIVNFGILYNTVRMNLSENSRELASLRVLGLSKGEIAYILYGELTILVVLSIPLGLLFGYALSVALVHSFQSDLYRFPMMIYPSAYPYTALITIVSAFFSALAVYPRIHNLNLIEVLKTRE
ncbi:MAG: ABC transporter permease, partial [Gammaproteobacteria bacterium]